MNVTIHVVCPEIVEQLRLLNSRAAYIIKQLFRPPWPGPVSLRVISQGDNNMLQYELDLPPKSASDVAKRIIVVNGTSTDLQPDALVFPGEGEMGDPVTGSLTDVDASNNQSVPRPFDFVLSDTVPPGEPGEVGIRITGQT